MHFEIIVVGTSLGGLEALETLLAALPVPFALPIAIVQHRSVVSDDMLLRTLRRRSTLPLHEPYDKEPVAPGQVYLAPSDYHLLIEADEFRLSTEGPVNYARPSIDVLFESAADACGDRTIGIVLTGANSDGARGAARIKQAGGVVIVQTPEEAVSPAMPRAALAATTVDFILTLAEISAYLISINTAEAAQR